MSESWRTEQSNARRDDIKTFDEVCFSCVKICNEDPRFQKVLHNCEGVTLNTTQKSELSNNATFIAETNHVMWNLFMSTISHGRTTVFMVVSAIETSKKAI